MSNEALLHSDADSPLVPPLPPVREALAARIETILLALRYALLGALLFTLFTGYDSDYTPPLLPAIIGAIVQNAWVHGVLYARRYRLFLTPLNFGIHLLKVALLVGLTGAEKSPLAFLFAMLVIGYGLYTSQYDVIYRLALLCAAAYAFVILVNWSIEGINPAPNAVMLNFAAIGMSAWLLANLGETLRRLQRETENRATALASSEAMLRTILNATADPILVFNEAEFIAEVNDRACEFLGVPRHKLVNRRFRSVLFDDGTLPNKLAALRMRGEYWGELVVVPEDGDERTVAFMARSFLRDNRRFYVALFHDLTEQKRLQEASRLAALRAEQANESLQQVNRMRLAFFSDISQRLRSPLSAVLGFIDLLLGEEIGEINADQRRALMASKKSAERMLALADQAMTVGGAEEPPQGPAGADAPLNAGRSDA